MNGRRDRSPANGVRNNSATREILTDRIVSAELNQILRSTQNTTLRHRILGRALDKLHIPAGKYRQLRLFITYFLYHYINSLDCYYFLFITAVLPRQNRRRGRIRISEPGVAGCQNVAVKFQLKLTGFQIVSRTIGKFRKHYTIGIK